MHDRPGHKHLGGRVRLGHDPNSAPLARFDQCLANDKRQKERLYVSNSGEDIQIAVYRLVLG